jgi:hypothetical protein
MFAQMILIILQVRLGAGKHVDDIAYDDNIEGLRLNFVTQPLCLIALALVKISIGMLLLRLTVSAKFKKFIWATIAFTGLAFVANFCKSAGGPWIYEPIPRLTSPSGCDVAMSASGIGVGQKCPRPLHASIEPQVCCILQLW